MFKIIESDITKSGNALSIFNRDMALFTKNWNNTQGFKNRLQSAFANPNIISQDDLTAIRKYNEAIKSGVGSQTAFYRCLSNSSTAAQNLAANAKYGTINTEGLTIATDQLTLAQRAAAFASKALGVALNIALNVGFILAINAIITGITKLVNRQKELREASEESAKAYDEQTKSLEDLRQKYIDIVDSESDVTTKTEELNEWKETLIDTYGFEKEAIEKVNTEREKGLELLDSEIEKNSRMARNEYLDKNKENVQTAYVELGTSGTDKWYSQITDEADGVSERITKLFDNVSIENLSYGMKDLDLSLDYNDEYDKLEQLKTIYNEFIELERDRKLTDSESRLFTWTKSEIEASEKAIEQWGTFYETGSEYNAANLYEDYLKTDEGNIEKVGKDTFLSWRNGLLEQAQTAEEKNELLGYIEKQFPDLEKYFNNLEEAKKKFMAYEGTNKYNFLADLSAEDLEAALQIPDLFEEGLEGASKKIEDFKKNNPIDADVDTSSLDELKEAYDKLSDSASDYSKNQKTLTSALEEQEKHGQLSASTIQELTEAGYAQALVTDKETGAVTLDINAYNRLNKAKKESIILEAEQQKSELEEKFKDEEKAISDLTTEMQYANAERRAAIVLEMQQHGLAMSDIAEEMSKIDGMIASLDAPDFGSGDSSKPTQVTDYEKWVAQQEHEIAMGRLEEDEAYYNEKLRRAEEAYNGLTEYEQDLWKVQEEIYNNSKKLAEDAFNNEHDLFEQRVDELEAYADKLSETSVTSDGIKLTTQEKYREIVSVYEEIRYAIEDEINRIVQAGVEGHEELLKELEEQAEETANQIKNTFKDAVEAEKSLLEKAKEAKSSDYDSQIDKVKEQQDAAKKAADAEIDAIQAKIDNLQKVNDEKQQEYDIEKAKQDLEKASQKTRKVYGADGSVEYRVDAEAVQEAKKNLDDLLLEKQIDNLENQKTLLEEMRDKESKSYDTLIADLEAQKEQDERQFDSLLQYLDNYLNPTKDTSNADVWSTIAKIEGAKFESGKWYDKDGNVIDIDELYSILEKDKDKKSNSSATSATTSSNNNQNTNSTQQNNTDKKGNNTAETNTDTTNAKQNFDTVAELLKKFNAPKEIIDKYLKGDLTGLLASYVNSPVVSQQFGKQGDLQSGIEYNIVNQNPTNNITIGDIVVSNPVGNSNDLAKELMANLPNAFKNQMYSNLKK